MLGNRSCGPEDGDAVGCLADHLPALNLDGPGEQPVGLCSEGLEIRFVQVLVQILLTRPILVEQEKCFVLRVLVKVIIDTSGFRTGQRDKIQQCLFGLLGLIWFGLEASDHSDSII